jgi:hypothetical protein
VVHRQLDGAPLRPGIRSRINKARQREGDVQQQPRTTHDLLLYLRHLGKLHLPARTENDTNK